MRRWVCSNKRCEGAFEEKPRHSARKVPYGWTWSEREKAWMHECYWAKGAKMLGMTHWVAKKEKE